MSKGFINIEVKGFKEVESFYRSLNKNAKAAMSVEVREMANEVKNAMQVDAPVDVARLKNSITANVQDLSVTFETKTIYAPYMEFGTKKRVNVPAWVGGYASQFQGSRGGAVDSKKAIAEWARKKGVDNWKAVWWSIMKNGVKPHPFFFTTKIGQNRLEIIKKRYKEALQQGLRNVKP